jgi:hypothetical protein
MPWALRQAAFTGRSLDLKQSQPLLHTDIARLKLGKVGAQVRAPLLQRQRAVSRVVLQFWSVWVPASLDDSQAVAVTMEQISRVWQLQQQYAPLSANHFTLPLTLAPSLQISRHVQSLPLRC